MDLNSKLTVLEKIYKIYDDFSVTMDIACKKHCCLCCTRSVTMTTIEGYRLLEGILAKGKGGLFRKIKESDKQTGFRPKITINEMAELCTEEGAFPEEENTSAGECFLLADKECSVYQYRPFGCRCFISKQNCAESGSATVDDFALTVNNIFLQVIEHVDAGGFSGNLTDVLSFLENAENRENLLSSKMINPSSVLIKNHPLKILMIPPEHRGKAQPIMDALNKLKY